MKKNDIFLGIYLLAAVVFLIIPILNVKLTMASVIALKGFSAGIVGGFGSIPRDTEYVWISDTVAFYDSVPYILKCIFHTIDLVDR